ncbi:MAG: tripartite tricarboxylate transporter substrate binding protein [Burkholderiaceae bacterium]
MHFRRRALLKASLAAAVVSPAARAQNPQPFRIVVPLSAGSGVDQSARVLADAVRQTSGRTAIVDNRPGAGGVIGTQEVSRAHADGNTVLLTTGGYTTNAVLMKKLPYDPIDDLLPVTLLTRSSGFALLVAQDSPFRTVQQFLAAAREQPGKLVYGSSGIGNTTHVMGALFCKGTGVDLLHVPFKGTPVPELIGGVVHCAFLSPAVASPAIRSGQLRGLAISGERRSTLLPATPTFTEAGLQVQDIPAWSGLFAPPKTSPQALASVYQLLSTAARSPSFSEYVRSNDGEIAMVPPAEFKSYVADEIARYRRMLPPLGIELG